MQADKEWEQLEDDVGRATGLLSSTGEHTVSVSRNPVRSFEVALHIRCW